MIEESDVKFMTDDMNTVGSIFISLSEVKDKNEFDQITARVKVTKVGESDVIGGGKNKQEITVGGNAKVTLWEGDIGKLALGSCYQVNQFVVREFMGRKHLSRPPNGGTVYAIDDDIGKVVDDTIDDEKIETLVVIGVHNVDIPTMFASSVRRGMWIQKRGSP